MGIPLPPPRRLPPTREKENGNYRKIVTCKPPNTFIQRKSFLEVFEDNLDLVYNILKIIAYIRALYLIREFCPIPFLR